MENALNAAIRISQTKCLLGDKKIALLAEQDSTAAAVVLPSDAVVRRVGDEYPMLLAPIGSPNLDPETGETRRVIDFTLLRTAGRYFIDVPGVGRSEAFEICGEE